MRFCLLFVIISTISLAQQEKLSIFFKTNSSRFNQDSVLILKNFIKKAQDTSLYSITLNGFTDSIGSEKNNLKLASNRINEVKKHLPISKNIKLKTTSFGENQTLSNKSIDYYRRVDVIINNKKEKPSLEVKNINPFSVEISNRLKDFKVKNKAIRLKLEFELNTTKFTPDSYPDLDVLAEFLLSDTTQNAKLFGHVCCLYNDVSLSLNRAKEVQNYLVKKGINIKRLSVKGFGNTRPLAHEVSPKEEQLNRRVEVLFY